MGRAYNPRPRRRPPHDITYENCRGVCQQFPSWNSAPTGRRPHSLSLTPYPLSFHILAHSFALSCIPRKLNPFVFKRFHTFCQKPPGVGVPPLRLPTSSRAHPKERSLGPPAAPFSQRGVSNEDLSCVYVERCPI